MSSVRGGGEDAEPAQVVRSVDFGAHRQTAVAAGGGKQGRYRVRDLASGDTWTFAADSVVDALAQYQSQVEGNELEWMDPYCEECGRPTELGVSAEHGPACSLHPTNCVGLNDRRGPEIVGGDR